MRIIEKKIVEAGKENFRIIANDKLSSNKAIAQVKAVLSKMDVDYEEEDLNPGEKLFTVKADTSDIEKLRNVSWKGGVFHESIIEAKQVGVLYHITSIKGLLSIIKTNQLQGAMNGISTTRDKNKWKTIKGLAGSQVMLVLDGDSLSNRYKIAPYQDRTDNYEDEAEEYIKTRVVKNINKYILRIVLLRPDNWMIDDKDIILYNRLMGKSIDTPFIAQTLASYLGDKGYEVEAVIAV